MKLDASPMLSWAEFATVAPDLAAFGLSRLEGRVAYLATVRSDGSPRLHPITPFIAGGHWFVYMDPVSPKCHDLRRDGRYVVHCGVEDEAGGKGEFLAAGHADETTAMREQAFAHARSIGRHPRDTYVLFELRIGEAAATVYEDGRPIRTKWKAASRI